LTSLIDLQELDLRTYRAHVGVVTQNTVFFSGSIRENVAYGDPDVSDERVEEALQMANAWEFVEKLPDRTETRLGENGIKLSGGQFQRLAIARALIRDPKILILDEATSALDVETEILVQEALKRVMQNRTALIVAHRLSTVRICDRIVVLQNGRIETQGSHDLLLQSENFYQRVVKATV
jgi:ATP-binding cassette subfamily B protein